MSDQDEPDELAPFQQTLADLLAALRTEAHLTQQQVADRIGYSRATVAGAEKRR
jgi:transcriptional regulator with XRE-family HTH domain